MKITIIGAGAMGGALACGLLSSTDTCFDISVTNPSEAPLQTLAAAGAAVSHDNKAFVADADIVVLAVKPWIIEGVINGIKDQLDYKRQTIVAIVASVSGKQLCTWLSKDGSLPQILIAMPNTAMTVGKSMTFIVPVNSTAETTASVTGIFNHVGESQVIDEAHLPAAMALASCGIAYAMRYVRAASEGGVELGIKASEAQRIVVATLKGAAALLERPGSHPESEIDKVTTPGGLTIRGLNEMEHAGFTSAVIRGLKACVS